MGNGLRKILKPGPNMVEIEKFSIIEIEINRIEIFGTEIKIGFYRIGFSGFFFDFGITSIISKNYDSIYFDTKFNEINLKPILWNPYSIPVPKINRYETDMYIGFKPNYYIKPVKK